MGRPAEVFNLQALAEIREADEAGTPRVETAERLGTTPKAIAATLSRKNRGKSSRVYVSGLRRGYMAVRLPEEKVALFDREARSRRMTRNQLIYHLLHRVADDDLFMAILDDDESQA